MYSTLQHMQVLFANSRCYVLVGAMESNITDSVKLIIDM